MHTIQDDALVFASETPNLEELIELYSQCSPLQDGWYGWNGWDRMLENDRTRFMVWAGQSADGKKWDKNMEDGNKAFPWDGASDSRIPLADELCNFVVDILTESFWRAVARVTGVEAGDMERSQYANKVVEWMTRTRLYPELINEIELHAQYAQTYGVSILYVCWERIIGYMRTSFTLEQLLRAMDGSEAGPVFLEAIMNPAREEEAIGAVQALHREYARAKLPTYMDYEPKPLPKDSARKVVRSLRAGERATVPIPYLKENSPKIRALKLWDEVFLPEETTDIQSARAIFIREWLSEQELRARALAEDWDQAWVEEAVKQKGKYSSWGRRNYESTATAISQGFALVSDEQRDMIECLYAFQKQVDSDGVEEVWYTVFHADVTRHPTNPQQKLYAKHEPLGYAHNEYPFVEYRRERPIRQLVGSRGIPQIVQTWQREVKVQHDGLTDHTSLGVLPPVTVPEISGVDYRFGPAVQVPVFSAGREPKFMDVPTRGSPIAFELIDRIERQTDRYFGRIRADEPPEPAIIKQQKQVRAFLGSASIALQQMFKLMRQYMDPEEFVRITGSEEPWGNDPFDVAQQFDYILSFDVSEMNHEFVTAKLKAISETVLPEDAAGIIDRAKLTYMKLRAIDPSFARELVSDQAGASQATFRQVQTDFAMMFLGNQPEYVENDPTAPMQLRFADQIVQMNPKYQEALRDDAHFRNLVQQWVKNRQFSVTQQENKQVGRLGVQQPKQIR